MPSNLVNQIKNTFLSNHIKVDEEWLTGCVEWVQSENPTFSPDNIYREAHKQWLLADLTEVGVQCLPDRVSQQKEPFTLTGKYSLQINSIVDISESFYDQWRRLNDKKLDEPDPVEEFRTQTKQPVKKKRLLKLELTDGTQIVDAMEYKLVACLSLKILPGCKILISGPLQCSNSVLLLTPSNVTLLGGEVDTLLVCNAYENMLLKGLGKPLNPKPRMDYEEMSVVEEPQVSRSQNRPVVMASFERPANPPPAPPAPTVLDDEDDDLLLGIEMENAQPDTSTGRPTSQELLDFQQDDDDIFNDTAILNTLDGNQPPVASTSREITLRDFVDESLFDEDFIPASQTRTPSILDRDYKFKIRGLSLVTIDQYKGLLEKEGASLGDRSFIIRAKFFQIVEKLFIKDEYWNMEVLLTDSWSKEQLRVRVLSVVLNKLSGRTAKEISLMYNCTKTHPQVKDDILETLDTLKEKIKNADCFMRINYSPDLPCVTLVDLIDPAPVLNNILHEKIRSENLSKVGK